MAMSARSRKEMNKLRELIWWVLSTPKPSNKCFFCKKTLLTDEQLEMIRDGWVRFGNATAPPMDLDITLHHIDGNHENNDPKNVAPSHTNSCHKPHHAKEVFRKYREAA
jgi:hypothetical protein